jgi:hypothetical protein
MYHKDIPGKTPEHEGATGDIGKCQYTRLSILFPALPFVPCETTMKAWVS